MTDTKDTKTNVGDTEAWPSEVVAQCDCSVVEPSCRYCDDRNTEPEDDPCAMCGPPDWLYFKDVRTPNAKGETSDE